MKKQLLFTLLITATTLSMYGMEEHTESPLTELVIPKSREELLSLITSTEIEVMEPKENSTGGIYYRATLHTDYILQAFICNFSFSNVFLGKDSHDCSIVREDAEERKRGCYKRICGLNHTYIPLIIAACEQKQR